MCGLCGMFESGRRWLDAAATLDPAAARRERASRVAIVREVLKSTRISIDDWEGARFILRGPTGKTEVVDNLFDLWRKAEALGRHKLDPLAQTFSHPANRPRSASSPHPDRLADAQRSDLSPLGGGEKRRRYAPLPSGERSAAKRPGEGEEVESNALRYQSPSGRTPLHVLTGFLGSGKTTLLNRMLRDPALADTAVLINEIGAVAIDHHLVERVEPGDGLDIIVLKGGCTCCTLRGDLVAALRELHVRRAAGTVPPFRRVVLETTGLADPAPVLFTLAGDPAIRHKFETGAIVATVDAVHGGMQIARHPECRKQIAAADRLVVTKSDLLQSGDDRQLIARLRRMNPAAEIVDARAKIDRLLEPANPVPGMPRMAAAHELGNGGHIHEHDGGRSGEHTPDVDSIAITLDEPLEWSAFAVWLTLFLHAHGDKVLRFKALVAIAGWPGPVALNGIHHLIHAPIHLAAWPPGPRTSRLVFIAQGLQMHAIEPSLRDFLAPLPLRSLREGEADEAIPTLSPVTALLRRQRSSQ